LILLLSSKYGFCPNNVDKKQIYVRKDNVVTFYPALANQILWKTYINYPVLQIGLSLRLSSAKVRENSYLGTKLLLEMPQANMLFEQTLRLHTRFTCRHEVLSFQPKVIFFGFLGFHFQYFNFYIVSFYYKVISFIGHFMIRFFHL
jgi:hypothetical protein